MFELIEIATGKVVDRHRNMSELEASISFKTRPGETYSEACKRYEIRKSNW